MILDPANLTQPERYKLLIGTIVPRPIAWVTSMSPDGLLNLAPFSYFTLAATDPMTLLFCPQVPTSIPKPKKDTLRNIEALHEFVINIGDEDNVKAINLSGTDLPYGDSEFEWAGVTPAPSQAIRVPRVAEAPVSYECTLQRIVEISDKPGGGWVVFGEVQRIHIRDDIYVGGRVILEKFRPIARLAGAGYARVTDTFEIPRVPPPENTAR